MTKNRQKILDLLQEEKNPLNARQIFDLLKETFDITTVYRGLQYLQEKQHLNSFVFDCNERGTERYYVSTQTDHSHYMHCRSCHEFIPFSDCPFKDSISDLEERYGFTIEEHEISFKGLCSNCQKDTKRNVTCVE